MARGVGSPVTEKDESVIVSVHDKRTIFSEFSEPLDSAVGVKNAVGEGKLGAEWVDEILEWNGERSDGGISVELERAGRPVLLFSIDGRLAIVWNIRPNLNGRTSVELSFGYSCGECDLAGMKGDIQDRSLVERWAERDHREERGVNG